MSAKKTTKGAGWEELVERVGGSRAVRTAVARAVDDPAGYVRAHARPLAERGVRAPVPHLPFLALLDALDAEGRVALVDHRAAAEDVVAALRASKPKRKLAWAWLEEHDEDALDDLGIARLLGAIAASALPPELALVNLDTRSDQLALVLVEAAGAPALLAAAKAVKHPAERIAPKALRAPKARAKTGAAEGGAPMGEWPPCEADPPNSTRHFFHRERARSLWTRRWETAFDVMEGPAWEWSMERDQRELPTEEACGRAYAAFVRQLREAGWLQFTEDEAKRELFAHQAARKKKR